MDIPFSIKAALTLYNFLWRLAIPFLCFNRLLRPGFEQRTLRNKDLPEASVWIQAASAGKAYLAWEILKNITIVAPLHVLVTTNIKKSYDIFLEACDDLRENNNLHTHLRYCPFDRPSLMNMAIQLIHPKALILLETELWPGLLNACRNNNVTVSIVNARISPKNLKGYSSWKTLWRQLRPDIVHAISDDDALRFQALFPKTLIKRMPNIKFDRMRPALGNKTSDQNPIAPFLPAQSKFVVFGSIRKEEESQVIPAIQALQTKHPGLIIGLFPRHLHFIDYCQEKLTDARLKWSIRSHLTGKIQMGSLILWDTFGELIAAYELAQAAFVGGSLVPRGGHNVLEPLTCGVIPVSGPDWSDFSWLGKEIIDRGLLKIVNDWQELHQEITNQLKKPVNRDEVKQKAAQYIRKNQGGAELAAQTILEILEK